MSPALFMEITSTGQEEINPSVTLEDKKDEDSIYFSLKGQEIIMW